MYGMKMFARPEYLRGLTFLSCDLLERTSGLKRRWFGCGGEAGSPVTVVSLPARGRPPQAAARRAGLEVVEKLLTDSMVALLDGSEREHASPRSAPWHHLVGDAGQPEPSPPPPAVGPPRPLGFCEMSASAERCGSLRQGLGRFRFSRQSSTNRATRMPRMMAA